MIDTRSGTLYETRCRAGWIRGVAAFLVLFYHLGHWLGTPGIACNSNLAVDLFFFLSGCVLPLAYWSRRDKISTPQFILVRMSRLVPLIALGTLIGLAYAIFKIRMLHLEVAYSQLIAPAITGMWMIPIWGVPAAIGGPQIFPLNGPEYTLFFEVFANIVWWMTRGKDYRALLPWFIAANWLLVVFLGYGGDNEQTFLLGFPRVACTFAIGLLCYHYRDRYKLPPLFNKVVFASSGLLTLLLFLWPQELLRIQLGWIILVAPVLVATGAKLELSGAAAKISLALGAMSYPVYALHYPIFCWVNGAYQSKFAEHDFVIEAALVLIFVGGGAWLALHFYDELIRRHFLVRRRAAAVKKLEASSP